MNFKLSSPLYGTASSTCSSSSASSSTLCQQQQQQQQQPQYSSSINHIISHDNQENIPHLNNNNHHHQIQQHHYQQQQIQVHQQHSSLTLSNLNNQQVPLYSSSVSSSIGASQQPSSSLITKSMVIRPPQSSSSSSMSTISDQNYYQQQQQQQQTNNYQQQQQQQHAGVKQQQSQSSQQQILQPPSSSSSSSISSSAENPLYVKEVINAGNQTIVKEYRQGDFLGKGGFAKCYHMTEIETNRVYAAKIVPKASLQKPRARSKLKTEIRIHGSLNHENIVKFEHCFETQENVYILLGLCNQKTVMDLHKRRKFLLEAEVKYYVYQVIQAVKYLHANKIIHRDLKLGNLFIDNMRIKVGDFGLSTRIEHEGERKKTICGTPNYLAPEVLDNSNGHSYEVDVWSIGIILYTLLIGKPPFETTDVRQTYQRIRSNQYAFPEEPIITENAKNLIVSILNPIPEKRPTLNQILENDFFCLTSIPKSLPVSALTHIPAQLLRSSVNVTPLSENTNIINQQQSTMITSPTKSQQHQSPHKPYNNHIITLSPSSQQKLSEMEKDDFHFRKLRRIEKMRENDLKTKLLKQKLALPIDQQHQQSSSQQQQEQKFSDQSICSNVKELETRIANNHISDPIVKREPLNGFPQSLVFIISFADYSNKYGLGYQLSNGSVGAYFNDSTKVISFINSGIAHYMEHAKGTEGDGRRVLNVNETHPHDTNKKVTLIKYFSNHFTTQPVKFSCNLLNNNNNNQQQQDTSNPSVYVKKWLKTDKGTAFRLSDKTIQVNFNDKSIIIITKDQTVTYVASDETTIKTDKLSHFLHDLDTKIVSRIKYTREILINLYHKKPEDMGYNK